MMLLACERLNGYFKGWPKYDRICGKYSSETMRDFFDDATPISLSTLPQIQTTSVRPQMAGKIFERCELARELRDKHNIPVGQVGDWVCEAQYKSKFNTSARDRDGGHGIFSFQSSWCGPNGYCQISCEDLLDDDITDDVDCMREYIVQYGYFNVQKRWKDHNCAERSSGFIEGCFGEESELTITTTASPPQWPAAINQPGKAHRTSELCQLAREMRDKYHFPAAQVGDRLCNGQYASEFITLARAYEWGRGTFFVGYGCHWLPKVALTFCLI